MQLSIYLFPALWGWALAIWPAPQTFQTGHSAVWLKQDVQVTYNGEKLSVSPSSSPSSSGKNQVTPQAIVGGAVSRALDTILNKGFVPWKLFPRHKLSDFEPSGDSAKIYVPSITITQTGNGNSSKPTLVAGDTDESYALDVGTDGATTIRAVSTTGVLHALQSFVQLFYQHSSGTGTYINIVPVSIRDKPKFTYRGLNLDVARSWYPVNDILRTIDALSWNKFNVLHLHMSDSQSWPMEIPALPELAAKGSYASGLTYSPQDIENIHTYALQRGVTIIIEFDMPGHTTAIGLAYPDLIAAFEAKPWGSYCAEPPCGTLQLNNPDVGKFLEKLFADVLPRVQNYTGYFHTGGDEVNANAYSLDPTIKSSNRNIIRKYLQKFVDRNHAQVRAAGLSPIVWEEMVDPQQWGLTLGKDVIIQSWYGNVADYVAKGYRTLAGSSQYWYLDCGRGAWLNYENGASFKGGFPFNDYCSPVKNWRLVYAYDPLAGVPAASAHLVIGGEVHLWSEQTDGVNVDDMLWPRASAAGEVLWSGRQDSSGANRSQLTAAPRLQEMRERMVLQGLNCGPVHMPFCTQHNATECS